MWSLGERLQMSQAAAFVTYCSGPRADIGSQARGVEPGQHECHKNTLFFLGQAGCKLHAADGRSRWVCVDWCERTMRSTHQLLWIVCDRRSSRQSSRGRPNGRQNAAQRHIVYKTNILKVTSNGCESSLIHSLHHSSKLTTHLSLTRKRVSSLCWWHLTSHLLCCLWLLWQNASYTGYNCFCLWLDVFESSNSYSKRKCFSLMACRTSSKIFDPVFSCRQKIDGRGRASPAYRSSTDCSIQAPAWFVSYLSNHLQRMVQPKVTTWLTVA
jgi:hypothetical protein